MSGFCTKIKNRNFNLYDLYEKSDWSDYCTKRYSFFLNNMQLKTNLAQIMTCCLSGLNSSIKIQNNNNL